MLRSAHTFTTLGESELARRTCRPCAHRDAAELGDRTGLALETVAELIMEKVEREDRSASAWLAHKPLHEQAGIGVGHAPGVRAEALLAVEGVSAGVVGEYPQVRRSVPYRRLHEPMSEAGTSM